MNTNLQRMNFFNGLFLTQDEFNLEQAYHRHMRNLHNREFHGWGIVQGLKVQETGEKKVEIASGVALSPAQESALETGREIVYINEGPLSLANYENGTALYLCLDYREEEEDVDPDKGGEEKIHIREMGAVTAVLAKPVMGTRIVIAKVTIESDQAKVSYLESDGSLIRHYAGLKVKHAETESLFFRPSPSDAGNGNNGAPPQLKGLIAVSGDGIQIESGLTEIKGPLTVSGALNVEGGSGAADLHITGDLQVDGNTSLASLTASGLCTFQGGMQIEGDSTITGNNLQINSTHTGINGPLSVAQAVTIGSAETSADVKVHGAVEADSMSITGNCTVQGDLNVTGALNQVNETELNVEDNIIRVNRFSEDIENPSPLAGLEVYRGKSGDDARLVWDEAADRWKMGAGGALYDILYGDLFNLGGNGEYTFNTPLNVNGSLQVTGDSNLNGRVVIGTFSDPKDVEVTGQLNVAGESVLPSAKIRRLNVEGDMEVQGVVMQINAEQVAIETEKMSVNTRDFAVSGRVHADSFEGDGSKLTGIISSYWQKTGNNGDGSIHYAGRAAIGARRGSDHQLSLQCNTEEGAEGLLLLGSEDELLGNTVHQMISFGRDRAYEIFHQDECFLGKNMLGFRIATETAFGIWNTDQKPLLEVRAEDGMTYLRKLGIGVSGSDSALAVRGVIESTTGGIKFPDGSVQTTSAETTDSLWKSVETGGVFIDQSVGIGIEPEAFFHVAGDVRIQQTLSAPGSLILKGGNGSLNIGGSQGTTVEDGMTVTGPLAVEAGLEAHTINAEDAHIQNRLDVTVLSAKQIEAEQTVIHSWTGEAPENFSEQINKIQAEVDQIQGHISGNLEVNTLRAVRIEVHDRLDVTNLRTNEQAYIGELNVDRNSSFQGPAIMYTSLEVRGPLIAPFMESPRKLFVIDHPKNPDKQKLIHGSLEGPELGVYYRGEGRLKDGKAVITLPAYFEALTRKEGRTVLLTHKLDRVTRNAPGVTLAATAVKDGKFTVVDTGKTGPQAKFYWEVKAGRRDVEKLKVEVDK